MSKAVVFGWIAAALALGLSVSGAVGQGGAGSPSDMATTASTPPAAPPAAMVPPVRRVRPKTPPGRLAVPKAQDAASHNGSATARRGALSKVAAGRACAHGATFNRKLKRCERKKGAKTGRNVSATSRKR
jgi:hypothetical protein